MGGCAVVAPRGIRKKSPVPSSRRWKTPSWEAFCGCHLSPTAISRGVGKGEASANAIFSEGLQGSMPPRIVSVQPRGLRNWQRAYLNAFESAGWKIKGTAVAVLNNTAVRTWFAGRVRKFDGCGNAENVSRRPSRLCTERGGEYHSICPAQTMSAKIFSNQPKKCSQHSHAKMGSGADGRRIKRLSAKLSGVASPRAAL